MLEEYCLVIRNCCFISLLYNNNSGVSMVLFPRGRFLDFTICTTGACSSMVTLVVSLVKLFLKEKNNSTEFIMNMTLTFRYSDSRPKINLTGANKSRQYYYYKKKNKISRSNAAKRVTLSTEIYLFLLKNFLQDFLSSLDTHRE